MSNQFSRSQMMFGKSGIEKLNKARVAVFGIGGVGGYAAEALVRTGIGTIDIIDNDTVSITNINRQIIATHKTVGMLKVDAAKERLLDINPNCTINTYNTFFTPQNSGDFDFTKYDYVIDAIDTVAGKLELAVKCQKANTPIISSMGAGNKLDPTRFEVSDIYKTSVCPLAKVMRRELKTRGIKKLKVVYSKEEPIKPTEQSDEEVVGRRSIPSSNAFVPSAVGLIIAGEVIKDLLDI
ncbi:MAG: tRNA threonylcarbamoyladenosine dehydratase [Clostridium sp.]|nr:tRNA threonylcarbamoyladenosine dehydratase [Clostridium sp.]